MKLELRRKWLTDETTIGELYVDGWFHSFVLEDRYRPPPEPKVQGKTCIPLGHYPVKWTHSPRFNRDMLLVDQVPGFAGIRIHGGNTAGDTEGCLLPGMRREPNRVLESLKALSALEAKVVPVLKGGGTVTLDVVLEPAPAS